MNRGPGKNLLPGSTKLHINQCLEINEVLWHLCRPRLNIKPILAGRENPIIKIKWLWDYLSFIMGISKLSKQHLYIEMAPCRKFERKYRGHQSCIWKDTSPQNQLVNAGDDCVTDHYYACCCPATSVARETACIRITMVTSSYPRTIQKWRNISDIHHSNLFLLHHQKCICTHESKQIWYNTK